MCRSPRVDDDEYGVRLHTTEHTDAVLQRASVQRGYTLVIWRGRHVVEPQHRAHLHTHLLPRFVDDPAPGRPFPLLPRDGSEAQVDAHVLAADAVALRALLR